VAGPLISFLTDFGGESAPATCRGVMWGIAHDARILDLNHNVRKFAVRDGAFLLSRAVPYLPVGTHLAVVDPGVGTARRPIALAVGRGDRLVGPDNGLLLPAARALGGVVAAHELTAREYFLPSVSSTFHGRDVFAPVAAHLAAGVPLERLGPPVDPSTLVDLRLPEPVVRDGGLDSAVLFVDSFGNCRVAGERADLEAIVGALTSDTPVRVVIGGLGHEMTWADTFGDVEAGRSLVYDDADYAGLAIAVNQGSAAERYGLAIDVPVRLERAR
jgi:S-adenosylmethionine hydrolase